ncbi:MAG: hypothetical protein M1495_09395, partial [Bacteroidetes bacterium]|nr:hypothetical protein [Bacteroidota bacterium]
MKAFGRTAILSIMVLIVIVVIQNFNNSSAQEKKKDGQVNSKGKKMEFKVEKTDKEWKETL